jgi:hypothetical protein
MPGAQIAQFATANVGSSHPYDLLEFRVDLTEDQIKQRRQDWCNASFEEAQNWLMRSEEAVEVDNYISYLMGKQWPTKRPSYKAAPVNNLLLRSMEQTIATLTDIRTAYEVVSENKIWDEQAQMLTKTAKSWWVNQNIDLQLGMAVIHAYITTGFLRIVWNSRLYNGKGDFQVIPENINAILPIGQPTMDLQDWEGVIYTSARPLAWFKRKYPDAWYKVRPTQQLSTYTKNIAKPAFIGKTAFNMLSPQMQRALGGRPQYGESVVAQAKYTEFWLQDYSLNISKNDIRMGLEKSNWFYIVKPGERLYPRGRLIITGGEDFQTMYDGPNFHWHGRYPFICIRLKPVPWQFHGVSELRTKIPLQNIVNHILAGVLDMVKKAINPPLLFPSNAFSTSIQQSMDPSMPNSKLAYSPQSVSPPAYARPPELPSWIFNTMQYAEQSLQDDSGLLDLPGMARKKVSPAGDTLSQLKENQQTIMRLRGRHMEYAIAELGEQMTTNFLQFYTLSRRMMLNGIQGVTPQDVFDWNPETMVPAGVPPDQYVRNYSFKVTPGSLLNTNRQELSMLAMALRRQGDMSRKTLFEMLDMGPLYDKVMRELDEEKQRSLQEAVIQALMQAVPALGQMLGGGGGGAGGGPGGPKGLPPKGGQPPEGGGKGSQNPGNLIKQEG